MAATVFNHSLDFFSAADDPSCRLWAEKAMSLAEQASDGCKLLEMLKERYSGLTWQAD
jgi:hypothetical protein